MKRLILVGALPASGKTYLASRLARRLGGALYLDKDSLLPLSDAVFRAAGREIDRESEYYARELRGLEYGTILSIALDALRFSDTVIVNAPFTRELRDPGFVSGLEKRLGELGASLFPIWIEADPAVMRRRMEERGAERDRLKLQDWESYARRLDLSHPALFDDAAWKGRAFLYRNATEEEDRASMASLLTLIKAP